MTVVLVNQTFVASQLASLNEQLKDLGIRVTINGKKGIEVLGYVDTIASTKKPLKVKIRYDEGVNPIRASQEIGFLFIVRKGRFVLHKGKDK